MSKSDDMKDMHQEVKPMYPDMMGNQYADSPAAAFGGSTMNNKLPVTYDQFNNEIAADRPFHENTTPEQGSWNFSGKQYSEDWMGGNKDYGMNVGADFGKTPKVERTIVDNSRADRGKDA